MNMRRYDLGKKQILLFSIFLLQFSMQVQSQNCDVASTCSFFDYPQHYAIGLADVSLSQHLSLTCSGNFINDQDSSLRWLFSNDPSAPQLLSVPEDPNLTARGSNLELRNATQDYEGIYYCQTEYENGHHSAPEGVGCVFVLGHAFYKTCPETNTGIESCATATNLQAVVGESVEFDARVEFRHGGSCGLRQNVRLMFLDKVDENGDVIDTRFICNNLGRFGNISNCANYANVSVSFRGDHKYDIKLLLDGLTEADAGNYRVRVDLDNFAGGRRTSIFKNFSVSFTGMQGALPGGTLECSACSGSDPLLLLNGEVVSPNSTITFAQIKEGQQGLLCVTTNEGCCNASSNSTAQFLSPSNVPVTETPGSGLYVSKGKQVVRLNRRHGPAWTEEGTYCCSVHGRDGSAGATKCVEIVTCSCRATTTE